MDRLYLVVHRGEDGNSRDYKLIAVVKAKSKIEAQNIAEIPVSERGFFPAEKISNKEYLDLLIKKAKEFNILRKIKTQ